MKFARYGLLLRNGAHVRRFANVAEGRGLTIRPDLSLRPLRRTVDAVRKSRSRLDLH